MLTNSVFALATCLLSISAEEESKVYLSSHSLNKPYIDEKMRSKNFEFGGDTVVHTFKGIELTGDLTSRAGWLWSKHALPTMSWEVEFEFKVHGEGRRISGDGFAFWATTNDPETGDVFGSVNNFNGLGVFFDTYANSQHDHYFPYVSAMIGDGKTPYNVEKDGEPTKLGGCEANFRNRQLPTKALVRYIQKKHIQVKLLLNEEGTWVDCISLDHVSLPNIVYLGFSAHTGEVSDAHEIISITSHGLRNMTVPSSMPRPRQISVDESFGYFWKLMAIVVVGGLIYLIYRKNQQNHKRF
ncbi:hypothetical protein K7432_000628 [Basidiobolus ranarum]|uniref:L-type lectin-like domain-containing protein n=1 Tax=Basidiobolus ranarum TaxID=34480 RepID=A0ABR2WB00_9FUNG